MRARKYNKRVEVWATTSEPDGYGGNPVVTPILITKSWCKLVTLSSISAQNRSTEFGIIDTNDTIVLKLRKRNDITYNSTNLFFKYRNVDYIVQGEPVNVGFEDREIQITLKRESVKTHNTVKPIVNIGFPYTLPLQLS